MTPSGLIRESGKPRWDTPLTTSGCTMSFITALKAKGRDTRIDTTRPAQIAFLLPSSMSPPAFALVSGAAGEVTTTVNGRESRRNDRKGLLLGRRALQIDLLEVAADRIERVHDRARPQGSTPSHATSASPPDPRTRRSMRRRRGIRICAMPAGCFQ